jgi:galactokinase/mevalonate kinase-like predicted kinase
MIFRRKKSNHVDAVEQKFSSMMELVKDLSKADYERLKKAMDLGWQSYQTIRNVKTNEEKENADIYDAERILEKEAKEK